MVKKVVWISSYLPRSCGIAYYSESYLNALKKSMKKLKKKISFKIIAHTDASEADYPVINTNNKNWHKKVFKIIKEENPDIVHIQHEYGLYETHRDCNARVLELIKMIKEAGIPVVMTYHSVYKKLKGCHVNFVSKSLEMLDAGILHEDYQKRALKDNIKWEPKNVYVLPHGSEENIRINRREARKIFGYDSKLVVGCAGLASERKGFITIIRQWPKVVRKFQNAILALELKPESARKETRVYIGKVLKEIMESPVRSNIEIVVKDYNKIEFYRKLKSFDVLVLPYKSESQSGVLAHGLSVGTPLIVTDIEGLGAEVRNSKAGIAVKKRSDFYKAIIKMLSSEKLREKYSKNALEYVKNVNSWRIIAEKTIKIYEQFW